MEPGSTLTVKDVADLLFAARERIDFYLNFHVAVVVAVIGWLVSRKTALNLPMKGLVSVVYVVAASMNLLGLYSSYTFAEALRTDLLRMTADTLLTDTRLVLAQHSFLAHRVAAVWIHLALAVPILLIVWFARFTELEAPSAKPVPREAERKRAPRREIGD